MRRFMPSLSSLHAFDAAARYLSFTRAAEDLGITQSGISRQIRCLEEYLGLTLFERIGPRIILTEAGQRYYANVSDLLDQLEGVSIDAVRGRSTTDMLHIAVAPTLQIRWATPMLTQFHKAHPELLFELITCDGKTSPSDPKLDFMIARGTGNWADYRSDLLFSEELIVVGAPALIGDGVDFLCEEEFGRWTMLQNISRPSLWLHWLRNAQINYKGVISGPRFDLTESIIQAAIAGMGLAVLPRALITRELQKGLLRQAYAAAALSGEGIYLCAPVGRQSIGAAQTLRTWMMTQSRRRARAATPGSADQK